MIVGGPTATRRATAPSTTPPMNVTGEVAVLWAAVIVTGTYGV